MIRTNGIILFPGLFGQEEEEEGVVCCWQLKLSQRARARLVFEVNNKKYIFSNILYAPHTRYPLNEMTDHQSFHSKPVSSVSLITLYSQCIRRV